MGVETKRSDRIKHISQKRAKGLVKKILLIAAIAVIIAIALTMLLEPSSTISEPSSSLTGNVIAIAPQMPRVAVGDDVKIDIVSRDVQDVFGVQISVMYDSDVLTFVKVEEGSFLNQNGNEETMLLDVLDSRTDGLVKDFVLVRLGDVGTSGSGVIGTLTFKAKSAGSAYVSISSLSVANVQAQTLQVKTESSRVIVG